MLKEHEEPKEKARVKAQRRWKNGDAIKRLKEDLAKPKLVDPNKPPEIAETVTNYGRRDGPVRRFESKFLSDIRAMMEGHSAERLKHYLAAIEHRRVILLTEKLRRLKLAQQESEAPRYNGHNADELKGRDLFMAQQEPEASK
jgi:hypothetical protein